MVPLESFPDHLNSIQPKDWKTLFKYSRQVEHSDDYGGWRQLSASRVTEAIAISPVVSSELLTNILKTLYDMELIIHFDWGAWEEGSRRLAQEPFSADDLDAVTICKMITGIVRSDRFHEGSLVQAFQNGRMPTLLRSLEQLVCPR